MGRENKVIGALGEGIALGLLKRRGYRILGVNVKTPVGELDAVARHKGRIVFIEIKSRVTSSLGPPALSVTHKKEMKIIANALCYLKWHGLLDAPWQIDVVAVKLTDTLAPERIEIIENAVQRDTY